MHNSAALAQYQDVAVDCRVAGSSPHSLVSMLFDGILKNLAIANGAIDRQDISEKGSKISAAIRIIDSLRASLDLQKGGDLAENLLLRNGNLAAVLDFGGLGIGDPTVDLLDLWQPW